jgi:hypothetical protein
VRVFKERLYAVIRARPREGEGVFFLKGMTPVSYLVSNKPFLSEFYNFTIRLKIMIEVTQVNHIVNNLKSVKYSMEERLRPI